MSARPYRIVSVSLYAEELVALDAKVDAMRAAGYHASRSRVLVLSALALDDGALVRNIPRLREKPPKVAKTPEARVQWMAGRRCGSCGIRGHDKRTCMGAEKETKLLVEDVK